MPARHFGVRAGVPAPLRPGFDRLRRDLHVPDTFPDAVLAEAERAASRPSWPERDATAIPLVTIDPEGATDLDQAVHIARDGGGYRVVYAIADLTAFIRPGGAVDREAHARGVTLYAPNGRTPLHPPVLSEGAASLLPGLERPALLWEHTLDAEGRLTATTVGRARVRSREQLTYAGVQAALDAGTASAPLALLREVGLLRERLERERGGASLPMPDQEVTAHGDHWELEFRCPLRVEGWNAQVSLLTGMAAAGLMLDAGVGVLRTLPPAEDRDVARLRRIAAGLGIPWPPTTAYADFVRGLDASRPAHAAMLNACTDLFRGAGYAAFHGEPPEQPLHGAINAPYAHCTAPLRRLVDRYVGQVCVSVCADEPVPGWVLEELESLPDTMAGTLSRANRYERGIVDLVEALVLQPHVGRRFEAMVIEWDTRRRRGEVQLYDPAVQAPLVGERPRVGTPVVAELVEADVVAGRVRFRCCPEQ